MWLSAYIQHLNTAYTYYKRTCITLSDNLMFFFSTFFHFFSFLNKAPPLPTWQKGKQHNLINYLKFISGPSAMTTSL